MKNHWLNQQEQDHYYVLCTYINGHFFKLKEKDTVNNGWAVTGLGDSAKKFSSRAEAMMYYVKYVQPIDPSKWHSAKGRYLSCDLYEYSEMREL